MPANADGAMTQFYIYARVELAKVLFANKQYKDMDALTKSLAAKFNTTLGWDEWVPELTKKYKLKLFGT